MTVSLAMRKLFSFIRSLLTLVTVLMVFCSKSFFFSLCSKFKAIPQFLFCQEVQCTWFYVKVFDLLILEFCTQWKVGIYLHSSTHRHSMWPTPPFFSMCISESFIKKKSSVLWYVDLCLAFNLIPLINMFVYVPILCFVIIVTLEQLESRDGDTSSTSFITQYCLLILPIHEHVRSLIFLLASIFSLS